MSAIASWYAGAGANTAPPELSNLGPFDLGTFKGCSWNNQKTTVACITTAKPSCTLCPHDGGDMDKLCTLDDCIMDLEVTAVCKW